VDCSTDGGVVLLVDLRDNLELVFEPGSRYVGLRDFGVKDNRVAFGDLFLRFQRNGDVYR